MAFTDRQYDDYRRKLFEALWREVDPLAEEIDRTSHLPYERFMALFREHGLFGAVIPEEYGGIGLSTRQYLPVLAELAKISGAVRVWIHVHNTSARAIVVYGREEQKRELLPKIASGELSVAFSLTEANAGTGRDVKSNAVREGDHYLLSGEKHLITNADIAQLFMVLCHTDPALGAKGMSALLLNRDTAGFSIEAMPHLMGCRGAGHGVLMFKDCPVPVDSIVGEAGQGLDVFLGELDPSRVFVAASSLGIMERSLALSLAYAKQRVTFGKAIAERETVRSHLADMATDIQALRLMLDDAAGKIDSGLPCPVESNAAKLFGLEAVCRATDKAMLIFGGRAYLEGYPIERLYRDARLNVLEEGTPTILRLAIARQLLSGTDWL